MWTYLESCSGSGLCPLVPFHGLLAGAGRFRRLLHSHVCAVAGLGAVDPFLLSPSSSVWLLGLPQSVVISSQGDWPLPQ